MTVENEMKKQEKERDNLEYRKGNRNEARGKINEHDFYSKNCLTNLSFDKVGTILVHVR